MAKSVIVYSTPTCPYCKMAKAFLDEKGVKYADIDVSTDRQAAEQMVEKSSQFGVPVLEIDGEIVVGFDKEAIAKALGI
ncbi:MAG: glutaredoxin family protein [Patescibacteria group bacterium]|nr:glutaredoxin family protein [Patescibacteria group bacterium]